MTRQSRPIRLEPYRGYGSARIAYVRGRVLADAAFARAMPDDRRWRNLAGTWRRMRSREVPHARVVVRFQGSETEAVADAEGHVHTWVVPDAAPPPTSLWHPAELEIVHPAPQGPARGAAPVLVPAPTARLGVVSDIDDTVIRADVARLVSMVATVAAWPATSARSALR